MGAGAGAVMVVDCRQRHDRTSSFSSSSAFAWFGLCCCAFIVMLVLIIRLLLFTLVTLSRILFVLIGGRQGS